MRVTPEISPKGLCTSPLDRRWPSLFARGPLFLAAFCAAALGGACATDKPEVVASVENEYRALADNAEIQQRAAVASYEAGEAVARLDRAWRDDAKTAELEHLAALARDRMDIARARAEEVLYREQLAQLAKRRDELRLRARSLEASEATQQARRERARADEATELAGAQAEALSNARTRAKELEAQIATLETREDERGLVFTLDDVLFEFDSAKLAPGAVRTLSRVAGLLRDFPDRQLLIEGHTDAIGSATYNERLSRQRAEAVARVLEQEGVDSSRIETQGLGESVPIAPNDTSAGRQQNRRVELVLKNVASPARG